MKFADLRTVGLQVVPVVYVDRQSCTTAVEYPLAPDFLEVRLIGVVVVEVDLMVLTLAAIVDSQVLPDGKIVLHVGVLHLGHGAGVVAAHGCRAKGELAI